jgi:hypothetical protein
MDFFSQNLPSLNQLLSLYIPLFISALSLALAVCSLWISREEMIVSHRPYVRMVQPMNVDINGNDLFLIRCLNAPARMSILVRYYEIDGQGNKRELHVQRGNDAIIFPSTSSDDNTMHSVDYRLSNLAGCSRAQRIIKITYTPLSSKRPYFFMESIWFVVANGLVNVSKMEEEAS